jgi:hypothetical protein
VDIVIDVSFESSDAFKATVLAASQPVVLEPEVKSSPPPSAAKPVVAAERRTVWWPLAIIGFLAVVCATIAFLKSPLAQHPDVAPYANALLAQIDV